MDTVTHLQRVVEGPWVGEGEAGPFVHEAEVVPSSQAFAALLEAGHQAEVHTEEVPQPGSPSNPKTQNRTHKESEIATGLHGPRTC